MHFFAATLMLSQTNNLLRYISVRQYRFSSQIYMGHKYMGAKKLAQYDSLRFLARESKKIQHRKIVLDSRFFLSITKLHGPCWKNVLALHRNGLCLVSVFLPPLLTSPILLSSLCQLRRAAKTNQEKPKIHTDGHLYGQICKPLIQLERQQIIEQSKKAKSK